jgi:hypothetical protein
MPQKLPPRIDERWIRHDWRMWIRHDIARWMKPGVDPADVIPALARERAQQEAARQRACAAEDAALAAEIDDWRRAQAAINEEVKELNAEMARWRRRVAEEEAKYSPNQPRIPKRNPGAGQWTRIGGGSGQSPSPSVARPMGSVDIGNLTGSSETEGLFNVGPEDRSREGVELAANFNQIGSDGKPVTDIDGSPYYAPGGHHEMPKGVYSKWKLQPGTEKVFDQSTTGELPKGRVPIDDDGTLRGHFWDGSKGAHQKYNDAVKELSDSFMNERNITPETMTPDQARDLLKEIRESDEPRIRDYNRMIKTLRRVFRFRGGRE